MSAFDPKRTSGARFCCDAQDHQMTLALENTYVEYPKRGNAYGRAE
jgi:hypothetical protein